MRRSGEDDIPWKGNADRMKCLYKEVIKRHGWMTMHIEELEDKISSLSESGDKQAGQFIIQASDKNLPARNYSTKNLSTPHVRNARVSILAACTPETALDLLTSGGLKGCCRRVVFSHCIPHEQGDVDDMIDDMYDDNGELKEDQTALDEALTTHRDFAFYKWLMKHEEAGEGGMHYFKEEIPICQIGLLSPLKLFQRQYKQRNPQDPQLQYIEYPPHWLDESGHLTEAAYSIEDVYYQIKQNQIRYRSAVGTVGQIMLKERHIRVFTLAWALTVRKKLLEIETVEDAFNWDGKLDVQMTKAAHAFIKIFDYYTYLLMRIPTGRTSGSRSKALSNFGSGNSSQQSQTQLIALENAFKQKIMQVLVASARPSTTSSIVTRKLYGKKFKKLDNLTFIRLLTTIQCDDLFDVEPLQLENNRKWSVRITRKKLSEVVTHYSTQQKHSLYLTLCGLGVTVAEWSIAFGDQEVQWALRNKNLTN